MTPTKPTPRGKLVSSKPDHKATVRAAKAAKKVPQRDGLAKFAKEAAGRMR